MRNKKEIKNLLEKANGLYHPIKYKFYLVVDGVEPEVDEDTEVIVKFNVNTKRIKNEKETHV